ncbi:MAG: bacteriohemerythrin [Hormoscilla sp.]
MTSTWNESLKIGIPLIDLQHQQLLEQMDRLTEAMENQKSLQEIRRILIFLDQYVDTHFNYEEQCMHINKCPVAAKNKNAHAHFLKTLKSIHDRIEQQKYSSNGLIAQIDIELKNWFVNHIKGIDTQLTPYVNRGKK